MAAYDSNLATRGSGMSQARPATAVTPEEVSQFFENLASSGKQPLLHLASGTLGIDLRENGATEHWSVEVLKGDVCISHRRVRADAILRMDKSLFEQAVRGEANMTACLLRGSLEVEGDLGIVGAFERLLPGPKLSRESFFTRQEELSV
jgi:ubiquinone biosynthesis protein UbiJ